MPWLELIRYELGPIPMFMWQYAAVLGLLALTLVNLVLIHNLKSQRARLKFQRRSTLIWLMQSAPQIANVMLLNQS